MPFRTSSRRSKWLSRGAAAPGGPAAALSESRQHRNSNSPATAKHSDPHNTSTSTRGGHNTSGTHSDSSFEEGIGKEVYFHHDDDGVSAMHFGESVSGEDGTRRQQKEQKQKEQERRQRREQHVPVVAERSSSYTPPVLLDTIALADHSPNQDRNDTALNSKESSSKSNRKGNRFFRGSQRKQQRKQQAATPSEPPIRDKVVPNEGQQNLDTVSWQPHELPDSASADLLAFVSNMTLGSAAAALTSSAVGLSLLTLPPTTETTTTKSATPTLVRESLDRHIQVCLDHHRASANNNLNPFAGTSLPVDVDDVSFVQATAQGVDEAALQHVAEGEPQKAMEIFTALLQNQRKQRRGAYGHNTDGSFPSEPLTSTDEVVNESEIARTKSRLATLNLLVGNTKDAWTYSTSALQTYKKEGDLPVHLTLSTIELGLVHVQGGKLPRALRAWREALQLACLSLGYEHLQVAILLNNLGCLHFQMGNLSAAERAISESLELCRILLRANSHGEGNAIEMPLFQMCTTMLNLAVLSAQFKNYESSVSYLEEAIAIQESLAPSTSNKVYFAAETYLLECTRLRDSETRDATTTGENVSSQSVSTFNSIVQPTITIGLFGDADGIPRRHEASMQNQLSSRPQIREEESDYIYDVILLGSLVKPATARQRVHATITNSLDRVAKINQPELALVGDDDASFSSVTQTARKKHSIPVDLDGEFVIDAELMLEKIHFTALDHLQRNEFKDALDLFESALRNHKGKYGDIHHLVGTGLHNCGLVHMAAESYGQAKLCFQEAVGVRTAALGDSHPDVAVRIRFTPTVGLA